MISNLSPYINFNGTAAQAIALYERVLDATALTVARAGDVPGMNAPPEQKDHVLHGALRIGSSHLMVSDSAAGSPASNRGNVQVSLHFDDLDEMTSRFS